MLNEREGTFFLINMNKRLHKLFSGSLGKLIANTNWIIAGRLIQMALGFLVGIFVARTLGPEKYGILSYAVSVIAFFSTFVYLGLSGIVVRDIVLYPTKINTLLGTTISLKFAGSTLSFLAVIVVALVSYETSNNELWVLLIIGLSLFARPFETIDFWFQSQVQSKNSVIAQSSGYFIAAILKLILAYFGASLISFAFAYCSELILAAVFLVIIYNRKGFSIFRWKADLSTAIDILKQSWIIILSGFLGLVNLKVDQIMLRWMSGSAEVGIYSVAVTFSEVWYFIPSAIVLSVFPSMIALRKTNLPSFEGRLQQLLDVFFFIAFCVAVAVSLLAKPVILALYGEAYAGTPPILGIHIWAGVFMFMRAVLSRWILIENKLYYSLASHGFGAVMNVILNIILIPYQGGKGAAIATLFSYAVSSYLFLFLFKNTRSLALKMSKSLIFPLRLILYRNKIWAC